MVTEIRSLCFLEKMFSRNRFNGQHGAGVPPKGGAKSKVHPPKKRAPNPKVALVIRGKIHRLLQGSADHHVPDSHVCYVGTGQEEEQEVHDGRKEFRCYPKVSPRTEGVLPKSSIIKRHGASSEPSCVGEVELNREGCIKIPCTLQQKSCRRPASQKRISFESGLREASEPTRPVSYYSPVNPEVNGTKFASGVRHFSSPHSRPKRPYSAGDCVDYDFSRAQPNTLLEEDEDKEEASSAIIDHILKELRGINKIQEEISDLRDYLTSVRGSVEEVSSCVDAVLLEIEGIRSSSKEGSGTWSGIGCKDGPSVHKRPASAYGSLGNAVPKSSSNYFPPICNEHRNTHEEFLPTRSRKATVSQILTSAAQLELEETDDTSDHSSDIPEGATASTLNFGFLEQRDGQDCLSTSSLSSGHSSKSESDLERLSSSRPRNEQAVRNGKDIWTNTVPPQTRESVWHRETCHLRGGYLEMDDGESALCCEAAGSWDHCRGAGGYGGSLQSSTGSAEHVSINSGKHYNSLASSSSRKEWQSRKRRPQSHPKVHDPSTRFENSTVGYSDVSYPQSAGYRSAEGRDGEARGFDFEQTSDLSYTTNCETETYLAFEESSWTETLSTSGDNEFRPFTLKTEASNQSSTNQLPYPGGAELQPDSFTVKRFGQAGHDFSSVLQGALCKPEVPGAVNPGEQTNFELSVPSGMPSTEWPSKPLNYEATLKQTSGETQRRDIVCGYAFEELAKDRSIDESNLSVVPLLEETNSSLKLKSMKACHGLDKMPPCPKGFTVCPDTSTPDGFTEKPAGSSGEEPAKVPEGASPKAQRSRCTATDSSLVSVLVDESVALEGRGQAEVPRQPATGVPVGPRVQPEEDEPEPGIGQMDGYKLECVRTFQEILREKRESRRSLVSTSTFSQDDAEQGSHGTIPDCTFVLSCGFSS